jgi:galactokinase
MRETIAYAPGRVELLGNHTDYNEGVVLGAAIDRGLTVTGARRGDDLIVIHSALKGRFEIPTEELRPQQEQSWANYALGVAHELNSLGVAIKGFSADVDGNLPAGCGLSSSAAFEVATALFLLELFEREAPALEIAKLCQRAEHEFAGVQSGLLDQVVSIFGEANHAVFFDARTEEVRTIPFPSGLALIIANSGRGRELASGSYNARRKETRAAADALGVRALRDISSAELFKSDLSPLLKRRAAHVVGENERVWRALDLLRDGDGAGFGALLNESHESSRTNFENSTAELDLMVEIARKLPGVLGARLTGGGFGGAALILCKRDNAADIAEELSLQYSRGSDFKSQTFVSEVAGGARIVPTNFS